jgi:hypothetical protein
MPSEHVMPARRQMEPINTLVRARPETTPKLSQLRPSAASQIVRFCRRIEHPTRSGRVLYTHCVFATAVAIENRFDMYSGCVSGCPKLLIFGPTSPPAHSQVVSPSLLLSKGISTHPGVQASSGSLTAKALSAEPCALTTNINPSRARPHCAPVTRRIRRP